MTRDDIIRLAKEHTIGGLEFNEDGLLRFAAIIAAVERDLNKKKGATAMTTDDIIKMAIESGFFIDNDWIDDGLPSFKYFAALVAAHEREACALVAEEKTAAWTQDDYNSGCMDCAKAIRARGDK